MTAAGRLRIISKFEKREAALTLIAAERARQETLKAQGRFEFTAGDDGPTNADRLTWLAEELGEIAKEVTSQPDDGRGTLTHDTAGSVAGLRTEITQLAAICVAWLERF